MKLLIAFVTTITGTSIACAQYTVAPIPGCDYAVIYHGKYLLKGVGGTTQIDNLGNHQTWTTPFLFSVWNVGEDGTAVGSRPRSGGGWEAAYASYGSNATLPLSNPSNMPFSRAIDYDASSGMFAVAYSTLNNVRSAALVSAGGSVSPIGVDPDTSYEPVGFSAGGDLLLNRINDAGGWDTSAVYHHSGGNLRVDGHAIATADAEGGTAIGSSFYAETSVGAEWVGSQWLTVQRTIIRRLDGSIAYNLSPVTNLGFGLYSSCYGLTDTMAVLSSYDEAGLARSFTLNIQTGEVKEVPLLPGYNSLRLTSIDGSTLYGYAYHDGDQEHTIGVQVQAVPEPVTFATLGVGLLAIFRRRRA